ncbi:MAG: DUF4149 domain-containing protein [Proteobacteria bacterium]|nr:DUF4149 domain-containing protein [Pseudomonadota bacterium]MDA1132055.1 DUF4149 domain-containing protein [Pseudomonadota bacterium]
MTEWFLSGGAGQILTALLLGGMVFFSFVLTPVAFSRMEPAAGSAVIRAIFPVYTRVMAALSILASLLVAGTADALALAIVGGVFVAVLMILRPRIARAREERDRGDFAAEKRFRFLHSASVVINLGQIAAVAVVFVRLTA